MQHPRTNSGYAMVALLVGMSVMAVVLSVVLPMWRTAAQRERETELVFRGQQYAHAIALFQRKYANTFPPNVQVLVDQRFLRKKYTDPMTKDGAFQLLYAGGQPAGQGGQPAQTGTGRGVQPVATQPQPAVTQVTVGTAAPLAGAGIMGVASKSTETSLRIYNGHNKYNEWTFVAVQATTSAGAPTGSPTGGPGGRQGGAGGRQGPGGRQGGAGPGTGPRGGPPAPGAPQFPNRPGIAPGPGGPGFGPTDPRMPQPNGVPAPRPRL